MKKKIKLYPMTGRLIVTWGYIFASNHLTLERNCPTQNEKLLPPGFT